MTRALARCAPHVVLLVAFLSVACRSDEAPHVAPKERDLGAGDVALVGAEHIDGATVAAIAEAQGVSLAVARDRAIRDALFAQEARARGRAPRAAESAVLARTLMEQRRLELSGPVTDEELAVATRDHWLELDRPEGFRVVHAVARTKSPKTKKITDERWADADAVGARIAAAIGPVIERARAVPADDASVVAALKKATDMAGSGGLEVKVESLAPVAADGRVISANLGNFAPEFATAVSKLRERGDATPPFRSPFGVHVAILLERTAPLVIPTEQRRALVHDEIVAKRLLQEHRDIAGKLVSTVVVADNASALLDLVRVSSTDGIAAAVASPSPSQSASPSLKIGAP